MAGNTSVEMRNTGVAILLYRRVTYNPVNKTTISSIRIYITDGKRRLVNLNGADTSLSLILKRIE